MKEISRKHMNMNRFVIFLLTAIVPIRPPQLKLAAVHFDIPHPEGTAMFVGREWVFKDIDLVSTHKD